MHNTMYLILLAFAVLIIMIAFYNKRTPPEKMVAGCDIVGTDYFDNDVVARGEDFESMESDSYTTDIPEDNREMRGAVYGPRAYLGNPAQLERLGAFV